MLELVFTKDPAAVLRHLPIELVSAVEKLPPNEQLAFERGLMVSEKLKNENVVFTRSEVPPALLEIRKEGENPDEVATILLDKRICDGYESLLRLRLKSPLPRDLTDDAALLVWMRLEDGEWRILEIQPSEGHDRLNFEDGSMMEKFRAHNASENESSAVAAMRTYNTALVTYSSAYPSIGFASRLEALGGSDQENANADHAALIEPSLSTEPFEKSGYRFTYRSVFQGGKSSTYTLIARPIAYAADTKRSFFTDESGVIRWTEEDREPTASDPPLQ